MTRTGLAVLTYKNLGSHVLQSSQISARKLVSVRSTCASVLDPVLFWQEATMAREASWQQREDELNKQLWKLKSELFLAQCEHDSDVIYHELRDRYEEIVDELTDIEFERQLYYDVTHCGD